VRCVVVVGGGVNAKKWSSCLLIAAETFSVAENVLDVHVVPQLFESEI